MRIVQLNPYFFPHRGGIERRIYHVSRELARRGHEVLVITSRLPGTPEFEEREGFRILRLPSVFVPVRRNPPYVFMKGVGEALRRARPDVVDLHYRWAPEVTRAAQRSGSPFVLTWHNVFGEGSGLLRPLSLLNDRTFRRVCLQSARVVCISSHVRSGLLLQGIPEEKLVVVENGAQRPDPHSFESEPDDGREPPPPPYAVAVGRLVREKGVDLVIRTVREAVEEGVDVRVSLCGTGPLLNPLRRLARRLGVEERVRFEGWIPEETKFRFFEGALALLHLPRFESFGIAAAEALVVGLPVVASDVGGLPEVVGDSGLVVPPEDPIGAAAALEILARDPVFRSVLSSRARERASALGWERVADRMEEIYLEASGR